MSDNETDEVEVYTDEETDAGSLLATAAVAGIGALVGFAAAKGYGMAKVIVQSKLDERRARKLVAEMERNDKDDDDKKK